MVLLNFAWMFCTLWQWFGICKFYYNEVFIVFFLYCCCYWLPTHSVGGGRVVTVVGVCRL